MLRESTPSVRRRRLRWATALGVAGAGSAVLVAGLWFLRVPIADFMLRSILAERGIEADFQLLDLDFGGAGVANLRLGPEEAPDVHVAGIDAELAWAGLSPRLAGVRLVEPRVRLRMDQAGRVSAGTLERLSSGEPSGQRPSLPRVRLDIVDGQALLEGPFGTLTAQFESTGTIGRDFSGLAWVPPTTRPGEAYALDAAQARLVLVSEGESLSFHLDAEAQRIVWDGARSDAMAMTATGQTPLDLAQAQIDLTLNAAALSGAGFNARGVEGSVTAQSAMAADRLALAEWRGGGALNAARVAQDGNVVLGARLEGALSGDGDSGAGTWRLVAARLDGYELNATAPALAGDIAFEMRGEETLRVNAQANLPQTRLDADTQADVRRFIPSADGAPIGPTLAQLESGLDAAMDRFNLVVPLQLNVVGGATRLLVSGPADIRAANGARVRITALRDDTPALVMTWPGGNLHGVMQVELSGGGLPNATLLLDAVDWAPDAAVEAEATLSIQDWRAGEASIATQDLLLSFTAPPEGEGRLDIDGPLRVTGPLGDGRVRDLAMDLDLSVRFDEGWRVAPRDGCLPMTLASLEVAGLAFQSGRFSLCAQNGALIAANANDQLSGGFVIQALRLDGRMAGPEGQPAHLRSTAVSGRFSGTPDDVFLQVEARTPSLAIEFDETRTMEVTGDRVTADARIGGGAWRVDGVFESGLLADPALPGNVSAIAGRWSAAPEDGEAVIRVAAGEARVIAATPPDDAADQRPLFNPMRLADVEATLAGGVLNANGRLVLEDGARQLATFTAHHQLETGAGVADIVAEQLVFDQNLQPYEVTELLRGVVENVRGPASGSAQIVWTRDTLTSTGVARPNGLSLAASTIPVIENVTGEVRFDNLFELTTPPGQQLRIGLLNPGVAVRDGVITFQLLGDQRVAIEGAAFDFASGVLGVAPTTITLGAEETQFELTLRDVDVAQFIEQLNMPDLRATGHVEGAFPLRLTPRSAYVENGVLRAAPGGGTIAYVGQAGEGATGPAALAFDALRSFRYDDLSIQLSGDLSGDVVTSISFSGENIGASVDLGTVGPVQGLGGVRVTGVPFRFNVTVTAPFRRLAETAAGVTDARNALEQAVRDRPDGAQNGDQDEQGESQEVDQAPALPR